MIIADTICPKCLGCNWRTDVIGRDDEFVPVYEVVCLGCGHSFPEEKWVLWTMMHKIEYENLTKDEQRSTLVP